MIIYLFNFIKNFFYSNAIMAKNQAMFDLLTNVVIFGAVIGGAYYGYTNNFLGVRAMVEKGFQPVSMQQDMIGAGMMPPPPMVSQYPTTGGAPFSPTGSIPNLSGFESGFSPGGGPIPGGAPGISYQNAMYDSPFGTPSIDPRTGIDYSLYYPPTGAGTLPGTNPTPYPNPCMPGYYRASDLKCYPIPTQFPGNGCGTGMYLANDSRCYPYPTGAAGGGYGPGGGGGGYAPTPCPLGEYRASDGKCYALPTPPPETCPTGAYRASDGKCYAITPGGTVGDCPTGYAKGSDGVCRASTICPAGYSMTNGVCVANQITCPAGYTNQNGVCVGTGGQGPTCPAGYVMSGGVCIPAPTGSPLNIPLGPLMLIKPLPPGVSPSQFCKSCIHREEMGEVDSDFWAAVMLRPQFSGGVPQYAVIIKAEDSEDYRDGMSKLGFVPLTPDHLMRYQPATGGFYGSSSYYAENPRAKKMRKLNNRIAERYR
jgi:hypothetical protein